MARDRRTKAQLLEEIEQLRAELESLTSGMPPQVEVTAKPVEQPVHRPVQRERFTRRSQPQGDISIKNSVYDQDELAQIWTKARELRLRNPEALRLMGVQYSLNELKDKKVPVPELLKRLETAAVPQQ